MLKEVYLQKWGGKAKLVKIYGSTRTKLELDPFDGMVKIYVAGQGFSGVAGMYRGMERASAVLQEFVEATKRPDGKYRFPDV